ncbi:hypothetical protein MARPO_0010s0001 [Marchantia polymorpha]|uniref:YbaK/aminoacyl-tRNA synthetase-associated domain-containing protein n=2 Tax=Marchantia polymorpha TaxID=3197 RepID=A0A2R6XKE5_MARPO|nr:hypothetical protein MARPO_0010s0001 [Marchantia polymorpha]PTQ46578.1 hypothetical protein MARPO_0010s0001 [Marchantia polymorpha]PTQ46581.1 hypothetical protein MARPO_0010s0001 [Marchantia polymorpha]|eukprot:PTQ46574.1 hypothetical protein MARPO_0010s0001 [Marchantia polymorpha]
MASPHTKESLLAFLEVNQIEAKTYDHPKVLTVEEQANYVGHLEGGHSKNLLLKDKKNRLILISALTSAKIDLKVLSQRLGLGKSGLRMAPEDIMQASLKVPLGCVTPFALQNDSARSVTLLLDEGFRMKSKVFFHPLSNDATTAVSPSGLDKFLRLIGREPVYVDLEAIVVVSKEQQPDLASYLVDMSTECITKDQATIETRAVQASLPVLIQGMNDDVTKSVVKPKSKASPTAPQMEFVKPAGADVQATTKSILDEFLSAVQKEVTSQVVEKQGEEVATVTSNSWRQRLVPELESMLVAFKNAAYTEGFVAGIASCSRAKGKGQT